MFGFVLFLGEELAHQSFKFFEIGVALGIEHFVESVMRLLAMVRRVLCLRVLTASAIAHRLVALRTGRSVFRGFGIDGFLFLCLFLFFGFSLGVVRETAEDLNSVRGLADDAEDRARMNRRSRD